MLLEENLHCSEFVRKLMDTEFVSRGENYDTIIVSEVEGRGKSRVGNCTREKMVS